MFPSSVLARPVDRCAKNPGLFARVAAAFAAMRSRRHLAQLDQDRLDDLGISAASAQSEANRLIWDVPAHWIK